MEVQALQLMLLYWLKRRRQNKRRNWVRRIRQRRETGEYYHLMEDALNDEEKCLSYIRMKPATFQLLLEKVGPSIQKRRTNFRKPLSPKERLVITLRYLASGESHVSLSCHFRAGVSTIRGITKETCQAIWKVLKKEVMPVPDKEMWLKIAKDFYTKFNFPLCLGAIDGKHIRIKKPNKSGAEYYNYKEFFSIVLLAVTDAYGKFVVIDAGSCGGNSDGGIFTHSDFGRRLLSGNLELPDETVIPETSIKLPFAFVADDAFPLRENIMKPFRHRQLTVEKEIFNYRLSRARNSVECSFGKLAQMWRILFRPMEEQPKSATDIVKAITVLHNFIMIQEPHRSTVIDIVDQALTEPGMSTIETSSNYRATKNAVRNRETFMHYFNSNIGAIPRQRNMMYGQIDGRVKLEKIEMLEPQQI